MARTPVTHPHWYGMFCLDNAEQIAKRLEQMLYGQFYTFVTANSYDPDDHRFTSLDVCNGCCVTHPIRFSIEDGYAHIGVSDQHNSWGFHTKAQTEQDGRNGKPYDYVALNFEGDRLTIDHYAPARNRLRWIVAVEHHDPELAMYRPDDSAVSR